MFSTHRFTIAGLGGALTLALLPAACAPTLPVIAPPAIVMPAPPMGLPHVNSRAAPVVVVKTRPPPAPVRKPAPKQAPRTPPIPPVQPACGGLDYLLSRCR